MAENSTIFDKILAGEIPADKVYEDEDVLAFRDVNPQAPVHVLVIPKWRAEHFYDLQAQEANAVGRLFQAASKVATSLELDEAGYRVVINHGPHGQQSVQYMHIHILGGRQFNWPPG